MLSQESLFARARPIDLRRTDKVLWVLILGLVATIAWANIAVLDEQVRVRGKVVVSSRSQIVQAVDGGVLAKLLVKEGQIVKKGDLLAELDRSRFAASSAETRAKVLQLKASIQRLRAELDGKPLVFSEDIEAEEELVSSQRKLHEERMVLHRESQLSLRKALTLADEELAALKELEKTGDAARSEILNLRRQVLELSSKLENQRNETRRDAQAQLTKAQGELDQTLFVLERRDEALKATRLLAPMAGQVKDIKLTTIGAVLSAGEEMMQLVPTDEPMLVEARVASVDVAFVRPGLKANVKLDAFDFTVYGSMKGEVTYISPDTIDTDLEQGEDPYYRVLVRIDTLPSRAGREPVEMIPGMLTTVEIITGTRTVAQYMMKPLRRGSASAMTER